jgi:aspartate/tyrosine/aromatic aminotransferase
MESGRISMAGVNEHNVVYVAESFRDALAATATAAKM